MWLTYCCYGLFSCSLLALWLPGRGSSDAQPWQILFAGSLIVAYCSQVADWQLILAVVLLYALILVYRHSSRRWKPLAWISVFLLGLALELHLIPGGHNLLIFDKIQITPDAIPFSLYLNYDKATVGLLILGLTLTRLTTQREWLIMLKQVMLRLPLVILAILVLAFVLDFVRFEPKFPRQVWIWMFSNLLFTCVAEEGFFRGFCQKSLSELDYKYAEYVAIFVPALFFGAIHLAGGVKYALLASVAGVFYAWIYKLTRRIEASILTHFMLNLTHLLLFSYPALLSAVHYN